MRNRYPTRILVVIVLSLKVLEYQVDPNIVFVSGSDLNLDLVTLLVSAQTVIKSHNVTKWNDFMFCVEKMVFAN